MPREKREGGRRRRTDLLGCRFPTSLFFCSQAALVLYACVCYEHGLVVDILTREGREVLKRRDFGQASCRYVESTESSQWPLIAVFQTVKSHRELGSLLFFGRAGKGECTSVESPFFVWLDVFLFYYL